MTNKIVLFALLILSSSSIFSQNWKSYPYNPSGSLISFSKDEGHHIDESIEWWYSTGHISGNTSGTNYSYMLSYFYYPYQGFDGFRIFNITNEDTGEKYFDTNPINFGELSTDKLYLEANSFFLPKKESWKNKLGTNDVLLPFEYEIVAASNNAEIQLDYDTYKRPLIIGENGKIDQGSNSYSYYYSQTGINVTGSINFNGNSESVTGKAWIDRQYGSFNPLIDEKYEWLSIQLSNGMDFNIWNLFTVNNEIPDDIKYVLLSAYIDEDTQYTNKNFKLERLKYSFTNDNEMCYSSQWRLTSEINNIDLLISTRQDNSEVSLPFRFYEGSTIISGTVNGNAVTGIGFAELLHSYELPDIEFIHPIEGTFHSSENISWLLNNPDEGNPLRYDIAYSIDDKQSFNSIAVGITETSFHWAEPDIGSGENIWFKITAYSIDNTISSSIISASSSLFTLPVDELEENQMVLYPNPTNETIKIDLPGIASMVNYTISDVNGRILLQKEVNNTSELRLDIQHLKTGLYIIKLSSEERLMYSKFIVK